MSNTLEAYDKQVLLAKRIVQGHHEQHAAVLRVGHSYDLENYPEYELAVALLESIPKERLIEWFYGWMCTYMEEERLPHHIRTPRELVLVESTLHNVREAITSWEGEGEECDTCHGRGEIYTGETSGLDDDGNAPIFERCPECNP